MVKTKIKTWDDIFDGCLSKKVRVEKKIKIFRNELREEFGRNYERLIGNDKKNELSIMLEENEKLSTILDTYVNEFFPFLEEIKSDLDLIDDKDCKVSLRIIVIILIYYEEYGFNNFTPLGHNARYESIRKLIYQISIALDGNSPLPNTEIGSLNLNSGDIRYLFNMNGIVTIGQLIATINNNERVKNFRKNGKIKILRQALAEFGYIL